MHDGQSDEYVAFHHLLLNVFDNVLEGNYERSDFFKNKNHQHIVFVIIRIYH